MLPKKSAKSVDISEAVTAVNLVLTSFKSEILASPKFDSS